MKNAEIVVVGAGLVGLAAALGIAHVCPNNRTTVLGPPFAPDPDRPDTRTTAVFNPGLQLLKNLGVWPHIAGTAHPIAAIRIVDDMDHLLRSPETTFHANEIGQDAFGCNIVNAELIAALHAAVAANAHVTYVETSGVDAIERHDDGATLRTAEGNSYDAQLIVGADGRNSVSRQFAAIGTDSWDYDQTAIVCSFDHTVGHQNISTEFHRPGGPFTLVPVADKRSSLVWVERPNVAGRLKSMSDARFLQAMEKNTHGILGMVSNVGPRGMFPLKGQTAKKFGANQVALLGEAAHVMPPIGAQGLNLGYRDVGALIDCIEDAASDGTLQSNAIPAIVKAYDKDRRGDVQLRTFGVDLLSKSLTVQMLPVQLGRTVGLHALRLFGPLRRTLIKQGMAPVTGIPRSMKAKPDWLAA